MEAPFRLILYLLSFDPEGIAQNCRQDCKSLLGCRGYLCASCVEYRPAFTTILDLNTLDSFRPGKRNKPTCFLIPTKDLSHKFGNPCWKSFLFLDISTIIIKMMLRFVFSALVLLGQWDCSFEKDGLGLMVAAQVSFFIFNSIVA